MFFMDECTNKSVSNLVRHYRDLALLFSSNAVSQILIETVFCKKDCSTKQIC